MMNKRSVIILGVLSIALIGAIAAYSFLTPKGEINVAKADASHEVTASALYAAFSEDETAANDEYAGAVITISGVLQAVDQNEANEIQLSLASENDLGAVLCTLRDAPSDLTDLEIGNPVTIKGICTGYLFDVVIDQAILL